MADSTADEAILDDIDDNEYTLDKEREDALLEGIEFDNSDKEAISDSNISIGERNEDIKVVPEHDEDILELGIEEEDIEDNVDAPVGVINSKPEPVLLVVVEEEHVKNNVVSSSEVIINSQDDLSSVELVAEVITGDILSDKLTTENNGSSQVENEDEDNEIEAKMSDDEENCKDERDRFKTERSTILSLKNSLGRSGRNWDNIPDSLDDVIVPESENLLANRYLKQKGKLKFTNQNQPQNKSLPSESEPQHLSVIIHDRTEQRIVTKRQIVVVCNTSTATTSSDVYNFSSTPMHQNSWYMQHNERMNYPEFQQQLQQHCGDVSQMHPEQISYQSLSVQHQVQQHPLPQSNQAFPMLPLQRSQLPIQHWQVQEQQQQLVPLQRPQQQHLSQQIPQQHNIPPQQHMQLQQHIPPQHAPQQHIVQHQPGLQHHMVPQNHIPPQHISRQVIRPIVPSNSQPQMFPMQQQRPLSLMAGSVRHYRPYQFTHNQNIAHQNQPHSQPPFQMQPSYPRPHPGSYNNMPQQAIPNLPRHFPPPLRQTMVHPQQYTGSLQVVPQQVRHQVPVSHFQSMQPIVQRPVIRQPFPQNHVLNQPQPHQQVGLNNQQPYVQQHHNVPMMNQHNNPQNLYPSQNQFVPNQHLPYSMECGDENQNNLQPLPPGVRSPVKLSDAGVSSPRDQQGNAAMDAGYDYERINEIQHSGNSNFDKADGSNRKRPSTTNLEADNQKQGRYDNRIPNASNKNLIFVNRDTRDKNDKQVSSRKPLIGLLKAGGDSSPSKFVNRLGHNSSTNKTVHNVNKIDMPNLRSGAKIETQTGPKINNQENQIPQNRPPLIKNVNTPSTSTQENNQEIHQLFRLKYKGGKVMYKSVPVDPKNLSQLKKYVPNVTPNVNKVALQQPQSDSKSQPRRLVVTDISNIPANATQNGIIIKQNSSVECDNIRQAAATVSKKPPLLTLGERFSNLKPTSMQGDDEDDKLNTVINLGEKPGGRLVVVANSSSRTVNSIEKITCKVVVKNIASSTKSNQISKAASTCGTVKPSLEQAVVELEKAAVVKLDKLPLVEIDGEL